MVKVKNCMHRQVGMQIINYGRAPLQVDVPETYSSHFESNEKISVGVNGNYKFIDYKLPDWKSILLE